MTDWLTRNALTVAAVEAVAIIALLWISFSGPGEETVRVERDTVRAVQTDTVWQTRVDTFVRKPEPDSTLQAGRIDTVVRNDTVYVSETPPLQRYRQVYTGEFYHAVVTSQVRGRMVRQRAAVRVSRPTVTTTINTTIDTRTTRIRDPWAITAGGMVGGNRGSFGTLAPGLGLQTPSGLTVQYHYDLLSDLHLVSLHRSILTR